jgi:hypothetical protein
MSLFIWDNVITPTLNTPTVITPTLNTPTVITPTIITPTLNTSTVTNNLCNSGAFNNPNAVRDCPFNLKELLKVILSSGETSKKDSFLFHKQF